MSIYGKKKHEWPMTLTLSMHHWVYELYQVCSWDFDRMIKIFAMPIYGKIPLKIFFSGLERPKTLKLGMQSRLGTLVLPGLSKW